MFTWSSKIWQSTLSLVSEQALQEDYKCMSQTDIEENAMGITIQVDLIKVLANEQWTLSSVLTNTSDITKILTCSNYLHRIIFLIILCRPNCWTVQQNIFNGAI